LGLMCVVTMKPDNLLSIASEPLPQELFETLVQGKHVRIERIVSYGHSSPAKGWYDQQQHEWVIVLQGEALIVFNDGAEPCHLQVGDQLLIAAHREHQVRWTKPDTHTIWLAVFYDD